VVTGWGWAALVMVMVVLAPGMLEVFLHCQGKAKGLPGAARARVMGCKHKTGNMVIEVKYT
jgi:hypothetical protein